MCRCSSQDVQTQKNEQTLEIPCFKMVKCQMQENKKAAREIQSPIGLRKNLKGDFTKVLPDPSEVLSRDCGGNN